MVGVASINKDLAIKILKEKDHYNDWVFYYDLAQERQLGGGMNIPNNPGNSGGGVPGTSGPGPTGPPRTTGPPQMQQ
jgi:hypothetical protein